MNLFSTFNVEICDFNTLTFLKHRHIRSGSGDSGYSNPHSPLSLRHWSLYSCPLNVYRMFWIVEHRFNIPVHVCMKGN